MNKLSKDKNVFSPSKLREKKNILGLNMDIVSLCPYNECWKLEYEKEAKIIKQIMGELALDIQHVGSTSLPGIMAKPILDIAVAVKNKDALVSSLDILGKAGYDMLDNIESCGEVLARKGSPENRTHYIHVEILDSERWENHIFFRDYLLKYPELIKEYEKIKFDAMRQSECKRKEYTALKNDFIQKVLAAARKENEKK